MAIIAMGCIDFDLRLADCKAGRGGCTPELLIGAPDAGNACDGGACPTCSPACAVGQTCFEGACLGRACVDGTCSAEQVCLAGRCTQTTCLRTPCDASFTCVHGGCEPRACGAVTCAEGSACIEGACIDVSCAGVICDGGQCRNGSCQTTNLCQGKLPGEACERDRVCSQTGVCVSCTAGVSCTNNANKGCFAGVASCSSGVQSCDDGEQARPGTSCGPKAVCNAGGRCVECEAGKGCSTNPSACRLGVIACDTGGSLCVDGDPKKSSEPCGISSFCDGAGFCGSCTVGEVCTSNANPCLAGVTTCPNGTRACVDGAPKAAGTTCGPNQVCDSAHSCNACMVGEACSTNPTRCASGVISCGNGVRTCIDGAPKVAGASCGTNQVCDSAHSCNACTVGEPCTTNASACFEGVIACTNGLRSCINGAPKAAGASCGTNQVCDATHVCTACTVGEPCTTNSSACFDGVAACTNGVRSCVDGAPKPAGATCGTNQVCDAAHVCNACTAGAACTTNPNACFDGVTACTNGVRSCVDSAPKATGRSCGVNQVCDAAHVCSACTENAACTTNPGAPCAAGKAQCATGHPVCVDAAAPQSQVFYRDADADGFGNPALTQTVCGASPPAPSGYVANKTDCCDADARVKPGQTGSFTDPRACGGFDYDCSGAAEAQYTKGFTGCTFTALCDANGLGEPCSVGGAPGWGAPAADAQSRNKAFVTTSAVPACGASGTFVNGCGFVGNCSGDNCACSHKTACEFDVVASMKQPCH